MYAQQSFFKNLDSLLAKIIKEENQKCSPQELLELIFKEVYEFGNRTKWTDDATIVILKRGNI
jgi:serine phosphatase RsbU (regulator of sigma subunit)